MPGDEYFASSINDIAEHYRYTERFTKGNSRSFTLNGRFGRMATEPEAPSHLSFGIQAVQGANRPHYTLHRDGTSSKMYEGERRIWCKDEHYLTPRHLRPIQPLTVGNNVHHSHDSSSAPASNHSSFHANGFASSHHHVPHHLKGVLHDQVADLSSQAADQLFDRVIPADTYPRVNDFAHLTKDIATRDASNLVDRVVSGEDHPRLNALCHRICDVATNVHLYRIGGAAVIELLSSPEMQTEAQELAELKMLHDLHDAELKYPELKHEMDEYKQHVHSSEPWRLLQHGTEPESLQQHENSDRHLREHVYEPSVSHDLNHHSGQHRSHEEKAANDEAKEDLTMSDVPNDDLMTESDLFGGEVWASVDNAVNTSNLVLNNTVNIHERSLLPSALESHNTALTHSARPIFDVANTADAALTAMKWSAISDVGTSLFGPGSMKMDVNTILSHATKSAVSSSIRMFVHDQLSPKLFGDQLSSWNSGLVDAGVGIGVAFAFADVAAARKVAFESIINYGIHELGVPLNYGHTTTYVGGSLLGGQTRILSGVIERDFVSGSPVSGITVGGGLYSSRLLVQEGDYTVSRDTHGIGGTVGAGGVVQVSAGLGNRFERSSVLVRDEGVERVHSWFTREQSLKPEAQINAFGRMQDLGDLSFRDSLLLSVSNPLMAPLVLFSKIPAFNSYTETHNVRYRSDGLAYSEITGLELQLLRGAPLPSTLPSLASARMINLSDTSGLHQSAVSAISSQRLANNGRIESVMGHHTIDGVRNEGWGAIGHDNTRTHYNEGTIKEKNYRQSSFEQNGEHITDVVGSEVHQQFTDTMYTLSQGRSFLKWWKHEHHYKHGQNRQLGPITVRLDEHRRFRTHADGSHYEHRSTQDQLTDGVRRREESDFVQEESNVQLFNIREGQKNTHQLLHYGAWAQSIELNPVITLSANGVETTVVVTDFTDGHFTDRRMLNQNLIAAGADRFSESTEHHQHVTVTERARKDHTALYQSDVGYRTVAGLTGLTTVHVTKERDVNTDFVIRTTDTANTWTKHAIGVAETHIVNQQSNYQLISWGGLFGSHATVRDSHHETVSSTFQSTLEQGRTDIHGQNNTNVYGLGGFEEKVDPFQHSATAQRDYEALSSTSSNAGPASLCKTVTGDQYHQVTDLTMKVSERHTSKYGISDSTRPSCPPSLVELKAILDGQGDASILRRPATETELAGLGSMERERIAVGIRIESSLTHIDLDVNTNAATETRLTQYSDLVQRSELISGTGASAEFRDQRDVLVKPTSAIQTETKTSKGFFMNKVEKRTTTYRYDGSERQEVDCVDAKPALGASAASLRAANTGSAVLTGLALRKAAGHQVDVTDLTVAAAQVGQSAVTGHLVDKLSSLDAAIKGREMLKVEAGALKQTQSQVGSKAALCVAALAFNCAKHQLSKRKMKRKMLARQAREAKRKAENGKCPQSVPKIHPATWRQSAREAASVVGNTAMDLLPTAAQLMCKNSNAFGVALSVAMDSTRVAVGCYDGTIKREEAVQAGTTAVGTTLISTAASMGVSAGLGALSLSGLVVVIPVGIATGAAAVAGQYLMSSCWGWRKRINMRKEYSQLCKKYGIADEKCDDNTIRRVYRKVALTSHPDKNQGDAELFLQLKPDFDRLAELRTDLGVSSAGEQVELDGEKALKPSWMIWFRGFLQYLEKESQSAHASQSSSTSQRPVPSIEFIKEALQAFKPDGQNFREWQARNTDFI